MGDGMRMEGEDGGDQRNKKGRERYRVRREAKGREGRNRVRRGSGGMDDEKGDSEKEGGN